MIPDPLLEVRGLAKRYGRQVACEDVAFEIRPGEVLGLVGESGSGKSTIARCTALDLVPEAGSIRLDGEELVGVEGVRRRWLRSHRIGIVYQDATDGLDLDVSAGGNVAERLLAADWRHVGRIRERAGGLLERTEVGVARMDEAVATYSGGMRQRVQLAKALANRPRLLVLDEPTTGLDVSVQAAILDLVKDLQAELDLAMLVVSHDLGVIRLLAERTLVLRGGSVVETGLTEQILEDPQHPYTQLLVSSSLQ